MKTIALATAALLGLSAAAFAGEANNEPFPIPSAGVITQTQGAHYTMGSDAPFNYFVAAKPTPLTGYVQARGGNQDPFPFKSAGRMVYGQPAAPASAVAAQPGAGGHG